MRRLLAMTMAVVFIGLGSVAYAAGKTGNLNETLAVKNWKGKHLGTAKYVLVNPSTGSISFVILYLDDEQKKEVAVPLAVFSSYDQQGGVLVLNVSEKELVSAPEFHDSDLNDPSFAERVYRFFGLAPSWTEETRMGERM